MKSFKISLQSHSRSKTTCLLILKYTREFSPCFGDVWELHPEINLAKNWLIMYNDFILGTWHLAICTEQQLWQKATWMQLPFQNPSYSSRSLEWVITAGELKICFDTLSPRLSFVLVIDFLPHWKNILHLRKQFLTSFVLVCLHLEFFILQSLWWHLREDLLNSLGIVLLTEVDVL